MAEMKQYISLPQESGSVLISEDVIGTIVAQSVGEVEGIVGLSVKPVADIAEMIGFKNWGKGIKITVTESNQLHIECNVIVSYGQSVIDVAKNVQEVILNAVESVTGVAAAAVNVNVCGIVRL